MKKVFGAVGVLLIAIGVAWFVFFDGSAMLTTARKDLARKAQDAIIENSDTENVAALAMKAINLAQGEHGIELWRLKAEWGNMRRKDNIMELEKPRFTYYMPPDNKAVLIESDKGDIEQETQFIRFIDSVVATYEGRTLYAPLITYSGKPRELVCPQGGNIEGDGYEGSANRIVWHINEEIIEAFGDVDVMFEHDIFTPRPEPETTRNQPAGEQPGAENPQG